MEEKTQIATQEIVQNTDQTMTLTSMIMEEATAIVEPGGHLWSKTLTKKIGWYREIRDQRSQHHQRFNADTTWSTAHKCDNWVQELLDYMTINNIDAQDPNRKDVIACTNGYLDGVAKEFMQTWRLRSENQQKSLVDFLNDLRIFCVPSTDKERIWEEFAQVRQTVNGI